MCVCVYIFEGVGGPRMLGGLRESVSDLEGKNLL